MKKIIFFFAAMLLIISAVVAQKMSTTPQKGELEQTTGVSVRPQVSALNLFDQQTTVPEGFSGNTRATIFFDGFETSTGTALPSNWTSSNGSTASPWTTGASLTSGFTPHTGSRMALHLWNSSSMQARDAWMFTPAIALTQGVDYVVSFWLAQPGFVPDDEYDYFEAKIAQTASASAMATGFTVFYNTTVRMPGWNLVQATFTPTTTGNYYIGFHAFTPGGQGDYIAVDDVKVASLVNQPVIEIDNPIAFGTVYNNSPNPATKDVTIYNTGLQPLTVALDNLSPAISITGLPATIPALSSTVIKVTLDNSALVPGPYNGNIKLITNDPDNPTLNVAVTATVQSANILCTINENFNGGVWPVGWLQAGSFSIQTTGGVGNTGCVRSNVWSSNTQAALQTPLVYMGSNPELSFYYQVLNYSSPNPPSPSGCLIYAVFISTDFGANFTNILQGTHVSSSTFVKIEADVSAYANQVALIQVGFYWVSGDYYVRVDDFIAGTAMQNDLAVTAFTGNTDPMATKPENYSVTVRNSGTQPINSYTVSVLAADNTVLGTQSVTTPLAVGATNTIVFPITFPQSQAGAMAIKAVAIYNSDECSVNNTLWLVLNIKPHPGYELECSEGIVKAPGAISSNYRVPINTFWRHSYSQQIFTAAEVGIAAGNQITAIAYEYVRALAETKTNQSIYIGNLPTKTQFTSTTDWIPVAQMQLVKNPTTITYNNANPWFQIDFDVPFTYTGGNIVVAVLNNHGTYVNSTPTFNEHAGTANDFKTLHYQVDGTAHINPASPPTASSRVIYRSNTKFIGSCITYYILNPNNIYDEGAVVTVTSTPYPAPTGGSISVDFSCNVDCREIVDVIIDGVSMGPLTSYTFSDIQDILPLMHVVTDYIKIPITATADPNGKIVPPNATGSSTVYVNCGFDQKFSFLPNLGYVVDYFEVDGVVQPKKGSYTFTNVTTPHSINVYFKEAPYKIVFSPTDSTVIPVGREAEIVNGEIGMDDGDMQLFIFVPKPFHVIQAVYIDDVLNMGAMISGSYMFSNVHENHTVHVIFAPVTYNIFASTGPNGTINPSGNVAVPHGACKNFVINAHTGYVIDQIFINGVSIEIDDQLPTYTYTFCNVKADSTIYVTFKVATWKITVSWDACGNSKITPSNGNGGIVAVPHNAIQLFTFVPDEGCMVTEVLIDGVPYPNAIPLGYYKFDYVKSHRSIHVTFSKITFPVKSTINDHGVITPNGTTMVAYGEDIEYTWYTFPGYEVVNVFVDGINKSSAVEEGKYTFEDVKAPHYIDVITAQIVLNITAVAGEGGSITPAGIIPVVYGENKFFTFKAVPGYEIAQVLIDGFENMEAAINGAYSFVNVKEDHTIKVFFEKSRYSIEAIPPQGGIIEPAGITEVTYFDEITYTIIPEEGYELTSVFVNGNNMGAISSFIFSEVETNGKIEAFFAPAGEKDIDIYDLGISIYSNANIVKIDNKNLVPIKEVSIFDMYGRAVWKGNIYDKHNTITLNVATGIYSVRITTEEGIFTATKVNIQR